MSKATLLCPDDENDTWQKCSKWIIKRSFSVLQRPLNRRQLKLKSIAFFRLSLYFFLAFDVTLVNPLNIWWNGLMSLNFVCAHSRARTARTHFIMALLSCCASNEDDDKGKEEEEEAVVVVEIKTTAKTSNWIKWNPNWFPVSMKSSSRCWTGNRWQPQQNGKIHRLIANVWISSTSYRFTKLNAKKPTFFLCYGINALHYKLKQLFCCCCRRLIDSVRQMCDVCQRTLCCLIGWHFFWIFCNRKEVSTRFCSAGANGHFVPMYRNANYPKVSEQ